MTSVVCSSSFSFILLRSYLFGGNGIFGRLDFRKGMCKPVTAGDVVRRSDMVHGYKGTEVHRYIIIIIGILFLMQLQLQAIKPYLSRFTVP